ncbi:MAG TPA: beta-propeller fold lactonase family protein [Terracidiphilus sp.]|nr:beta-propeller fold lactonase family protein [Terracidiphilus sp.]
MKLNRSSQLVLASAASLLAAGLLTACGTLTVDFVYVSSALAAGPNNYGEIDVFEINSESGRMRTIPTSPFPSGGRFPVSEATSPDNTNLYVANQDDNSIVQFIIGSDGKLYPQHTTDTSGIFPISLAVGASNLFVVDRFQPLPTCSPADPCSGDIVVYPINSDDSLGTAVTDASIGATYWPLSLPAKPNDLVTPTSVTTASAGAYLYVTAVDSTSGGGYLFAYFVVPSGTYTVPSNATCPPLPVNQTAQSPGTLCTLAGSPYAAGTSPSNVAASPSGANLYVTDAGAASVLAYATTNGVPAPVSGSPFAAGNGPSAVVVDKSGSFVYVTNGTDSNIEAYSSSNGSLTELGTYPVGLQPVAMGIDPGLGQYLYAVGFLGNTISGFQINATNGSLLISQDSPAGTNSIPTAVAAIPHGTAFKK